MQAYKNVHFLGPNGEEHKPGAQLAAGASGRKKSLDDIARFLNFAVDVCGMPKRYLPPETKKIEELVGFKTVSTTQLGATSRQQLSDEQLLQFNMLLEEQTLKVS